MKKTFLIIGFLLMIFTTVFVCLFIIVRPDSPLCSTIIIKRMDDSALDALERGDPVEISDVSLSKLVENEYRALFYLDGGIIRRVVSNGNFVNRCSICPLGDKFGYLIDFDIYDKTIPYDRRTILYIEDIETREPKKIYHGSHKTSGWEWFSNNEVLVSYDCGSGCHLFYLININSGKKDTLYYGLGYQWSPNKKMVLAFDGFGKFGMTVGDKFGDIVFEFLKERPYYTRLVEQTKALWSPDSSKIALMIKKENQEILEMIVFDVEQDFHQIFREDLAGELEDIEFYWQDQGNTLFYKDLNGEQEIAF